jgi:hypothetical protein
MSSIGKLMSEKLDVLRLTFYTAPLTCIVLLPFYFNLEAADFRAYDTTSSNGYIGEFRLSLYQPIPDRSIIIRSPCQI